MVVDLDTPQLVETAEALTSWERTLQQLHGMMHDSATREWVDARIRATRKAGLAVQVQLIAPVAARPHVLEVATSERPDAPDPMDLYKRREEIARAADRAPGEIEEMRG